ncbi:MAG TPA: LysM peptidoglycan-binding domain-containing protein [Candidatus Ozemobacteraceae bacterium]|nr:LysM peptidoglycan-binding domain-containing protein [Candidatus Ozemobacteraceae bacterium]
MWSKLRNRHYSILALTAIVALETSAIAVDRLFAKPNDTAFEVVGTFRNNGLINQYRSADGKASPVPANLSAFQKTIPPAAATTRMAASSLPSITIPGARASERAAAPSITISDRADALRLATPENWVEYSVNRGDSLSSIASIFGSTSEAISQANGINDNRNLKSGQKIKVPVATPRVLYTVRDGDTLNRIASRFNVSLQELIHANNLKNHLLVTDQKLSIPTRVQSSQLELVKAEPRQSLTKPTLTIATGPKLSLVKVEPIQMIAPAKPTLTIAPFDSSTAAANRLQTNAAAPVAVPAPVKLTPPLPAVAPAPAVVKAVPAEKPIIAVKQTIQAAPATTPAAQLVKHTVKSGESLSSLARQYGTSISEIVASNQLTSSNLKPGTQVRIPTTRKQYKVTQGTSHRTNVRTGMAMPVRGRLSDGFGWRKHPVYRRRLFHSGIDIAAPRGTPIMSALPGTVVYSGWMSGYGRLVVIRHANGLSTRYGHCSKLNVRKGQTIRSGQVVGLVGATGTATGNHLHFEVRSNGKAVNPMTYLR